MKSTKLFTTILNLWKFATNMYGDRKKYLFASEQV